MIKRLPALLGVLFISLSILVGFGQDHQAINIQQLNAKLAAGELDKKAYMDAVDEWVNQQFASGVHFERDTLVSLLATWKTVAWSADSLDAYRINYYINLSNNANYANREGESVYFLEKAEQEVLATHGEKPLMVAGRKCNTYIDKRNYRNVIATYEKERAYIERFPELIRNKQLNLNIAASFINVLNPTVNAYAKLRDTIRLDQTIALAEQIHTELKARIKPEHNTAFTVNFYMQQLHYYKHFTLEDNREKAREALHAMRHALFGDTTRPASLVGRLQPVLATRLVEFFLKHQKNDSAAHYLAELKAIPGVFTDHDFTLNHFEAELLANQGRYREAYDRARAATSAIDSIQSILVDDIDDLLYANTDAEFSRAELQAAEKSKKQRLVWLIGVIVIASAAITTIYLMMARKDRKARALIDKLNNAVNIQVAAMEELTSQAVREEQQRLARELHDSLSSTLAGIKHQVNLLAMDHPTNPLAPKLEEIGGYMDEAYAIARGKSHQWLQQADTLHETSFKSRIQAILDTALPTGKYIKTIDIDDDALAGITIATRIELLRIIQEAVANIIKHAKSKLVSVLLYQEDNQLTMVVSNDGKESPGRPVPGIGIQSMQARANQLGGHLTVQSTNAGTEVLATIPLP